MTGETKKTEFKSAGGETLAAALELPERPHAYALFAHCFSCTKDIKAAREIARALRAKGFAVMRFDFTGLGASEGEFANTNFSSNVDDLVAAADFLRETYEAPSILIGHSLGGAAAIVAASRIPEVKGVATIGAPADAGHVVKQISEHRDEIEEKGFATVDLAGRPFTIKKQFLVDLENQDVTAAAENLKKPLLIMHAPLDKTVGIENAAKIFAAAKHPKSFISLDDADHLLSKPEDARYAAGVLAAWAGRYIGAPMEDAEPAETQDAASSYAAPPFAGGALAQTVPGEPLAVALSIDGYPMTIDASEEEGGHDLGPNPTRTVEGALAACGVMTIKMYARRKGWDVQSAEIRIRRGEKQESHTPGEFEKELAVSGDLDDEQKARLLEIADKCPVHRLLTRGVTVNSRLVSKF
ncbi:bifunctional alpha/beta hydrolase/OsmC family protein [Hyphococcus luteus]|uniref:Osmotically inducible protein C n=1 Tax=Hyphococcus luteus TaxID=2058213 RepID=A0A2S7K449_9PROT|nr:bifunctional alpha/beta hydrolase/OsmC family protein [Marinicaulis flavus]PQA87256.1 osmotically inducible protein C [Marinicaulis flavus]